MCPCLILCGSGLCAPSLSKGRIIPVSGFGLFPSQQRNAPVYRASLFLRHFQPMGNLLQRAQAAAAYIVAERGGAMADAGAVGSDVGLRGRGG